MKMLAASTLVDSHGMRQSKKNLVRMVNLINDPGEALPIGIQHDATVPPLGKIRDAELVAIQNGEWAVQLDQSIFDHSEEIEIDGEGSFIAEWIEGDIRPMKTRGEASDQNVFSTDPMNLGGVEGYKEFLEEVKISETFTP